MNRINIRNNTKATKIQLFLGSQAPNYQTTHDTRVTDEYISSANESDTTKALSCINT